MGFWKLEQINHPRGWVTITNKGAKIWIVIIFCKHLYIVLICVLLMIVNITICVFERINIFHKKNIKLKNIEKYFVILVFRVQ